MIKFRMRGMMWRRRLNQQEMCELTKIRPGTINAYFHGYAKRLNTKDLDIICKVLGCQVADILKYIPDRRKG